MLKVSVITPAYNVEKYIQACANSVLCQTGADIEWLVVKDASSDATLSILQDIAAKDTRVKVVNQKNKGISAARNAALERVSGDYFAFIDADDLWHSRLLSTCMPILNEKDIDLISFNYIHVGEDYGLNNNLLPKKPINLRIFQQLPLGRRIKHWFLQRRLG